MNIDELIEKLQEMKAKNGNIDVLCLGGRHHSPYQFSIGVEVAENYPADWQMPDGMKYLLISPLD